MVRDGADVAAVRITYTLNDAGESIKVDLSTSDTYPDVIDDLAARARALLAAALAEVMEQTRAPDELPVPPPPATGSATGTDTGD